MSERRRLSARSQAAVDPRRRPLRARRRGPSRAPPAHRSRRARPASRGLTRRSARRQRSSAKQHVEVPQRQRLDGEVERSARRCAARTSRRAGKLREHRGARRRSHIAARSALERGAVHGSPQTSASIATYRCSARSPSAARSNARCIRRANPNDSTIAERRAGSATRRRRSTPAKKSASRSDGADRQERRRRTASTTGTGAIARLGPLEKARELGGAERRQLPFDGERLAPLALRRQLLDGRLAIGISAGSRGREQPPPEAARAVRSWPAVRAISSATRGRRDRDRARRDARPDRDRAAPRTSGSAFQSRASRARPCALDAAADLGPLDARRCTRACRTTRTAKATRLAAPAAVATGWPCAMPHHRSATPPRKLASRSRESVTPRAAAASRRRGPRPRSALRTSRAGVMRDASPRCSAASSRA